MKFLIYGKGWISEHIQVILENSGDAFFIGNRVNNFKSTLREVERYSPDRIICCLGRTSGGKFTSIDYLQQEDKLDENLSCNLNAPMILAEISKQLNINMLYFGTGCIFNYDSKHTISNNIGYTENDFPNFTGSHYSTVKGYTDTLMRNYPTVLNARIRMPISESHHKRDFITKILNYPKIVSIPNSMTVLSDIIPTLIGLLHDSVGGTINATNPNSISHDEILKMVEKVNRDRLNYTLIDLSEQDKMLLSKRSNNLLDTTKIVHLHSEISHDIRLKYSIPPKLENIQSRMYEIVRNRKGRKYDIIQQKPKPRKIMVTGGCGFIASNFINYWHQKYPDDFILNVDRLDECSDVDNVINQTVNYRFVKCDVTDKNLILFLLQEYDIEYIFHFAAQTHVDHSFGNSIEFTKSNVLGTHTLLEAGRYYGKIQKFIHISTDEVYGEIPEGSSIEKSILDPTNPYAATKAGAEFIVKSFGKSFNFPYIITRGNNVYGPRQYPDKVIPKFITQLRSKQKMTIHGFGNNVRNFIYVDDVSRAVEAIFLKGEIHGIYNIGSNDEYSVNHIAKELLKRFYPQDDVADWVKSVPDRHFNDCRYSVNCDRLKSLGWKQEVDFETGIKRTIDWYVK